MLLRTLPFGLGCLVDFSRKKLFTVNISITWMFENILCKIHMWMCMIKCVPNTLSIRIRIEKNNKYDRTMGPGTGGSLKGFSFV